MRAVLRASLICFVLVACGGDDDVADVDAGNDGADAAAAGIDATSSMAIPDPGNGMNDWGPTPADWCSPDRAHPVGTVTQSPGYLEGTLCADTGLGFYVLRTGPAFTELNVGFGGGVATLDFVHLHEGEGLVFGPEVTPTMSTPSSGIWTVTPDTVYVLEVHAPGGGFF